MTWTKKMTIHEFLIDKKIKMIFNFIQSFESPEGSAKLQIFIKFKVIHKKLI